MGPAVRARLMRSGGTSCQAAVCSLFCLNSFLHSRSPPRPPLPTHTCPFPQVCRSPPIAPSLRLDPFLNHPSSRKSFQAVTDNLSHVLLYHFSYVLLSVFCQRFCWAGSVSVHIALDRTYFNYHDTKYCSYSSLGKENVKPL